MSRTIAALLAIISTALCGQLAEFEVASVRPHARGVPSTYPPTGGVGTNDPERIVYNGFTLGALLLPAFGVNHSYRVLGPDWLNGDQDRYYVTAIIPAGATKDQFSLMLRRLLVERFQIASHWEKKEVSGYGLLIGKNGPKTKASGSNGDEIGGPHEETANSECSRLHVGKSPDVQVSASARGVCFVAVQQPMSRLADFLDGTLTRPVADRTGLTGLYDFTLFYSVEGTFMDRTLRPDSEGAPYIITAVQEQLGLKLEPEKTRIDILVVDRANKTPSENQ